MECEKIIHGHRLTLELNDTTPESSGEYNCIVYSDQWEISTMAFLTVSGLHATLTKTISK